VPSSPAHCIVAVSFAISRSGNNSLPELGAVDPAAWTWVIDLTSHEDNLCERFAHRSGLRRRCSMRWSWPGVASWAFPSPY